MTQEDTIREIRHPSENEPVWVDVHSWLTSILSTIRKLDTPGVCESVPFFGAFRFAVQLSDRYWPAILLAPGETIAHDMGVAIHLLEAMLGKEIVVLHGGTRFLQAKAWISVAIDHTSPNLAKYRDLKERPRFIAVLHDTQAYRGRYEDAAIDRYMSGVKTNDCFAYVSLYALKSFQWDIVAAFEPEHKEYIHMPPTHNVRNTPWKDHHVKRAPHHSLSVGAIHPHKNFLRAAELSAFYFCEHHHVGSCFLEGEEREEWREFVRQDKVIWHDTVCDHQLSTAYFGAGMFIHTSYDEGFSMTPMEAMLFGVPRIVLSDIPAHREIYGKFNVNFVSPDRNDLSFPSKLVEVTEQDRELLYTTYTRDNMTADLNHYLANL